jgi:hypothetical protein
MPASRPRSTLANRVSALAAALVLGAACGPTLGEDDHVAGATTAPHGHASDSDGSLVGVTVDGDGLRLSIIHATPSEPIQGDNAWTLAVTNASGVPLEGFSVEVEPWMPDHGHGTAHAPVVTHHDGGVFRVASLDLWMAGLWEVRFTITPSAGDPETLVVSVSVA